jgi:hypothetical protein
MVRMGSSMVCLLSDWGAPIVACGTGANKRVLPLGEAYAYSYSGACLPRKAAMPMPAFG